MSILSTHKRSMFRRRIINTWERCHLDWPDDMMDPKTDIPFLEFITNHDTLAYLVGICACGATEEFFESLHRYFKYIQAQREILWNDEKKIQYDEFRDKYAFTRDEGFEITMMNLCDVLGLTDHGSSVRGAWLTDKGEVIRDILNLRYENHN